MVDFNDLGAIGRLYGEIRHIDEALAAFDAGGQIVAMAVASGSGMPVSISTIGIDYPAGMIDAIKDALVGRKTTIENELTDSGVTGMPQR